MWLAPPILQEVLQGANSPERFARWDRVMGELPMLVEKDSTAAARAAAHLYARCRWAGVTPRSANDCLIAVHAIDSRVPLLHHDRNFAACCPARRFLRSCLGRGRERGLSHPGQMSYHFLPSSVGGATVLTADAGTFEIAASFAAGLPVSAASGVGAGFSSSRISRVAGSVESRGVFAFSRWPYAIVGATL